jgi:hypothetical protein
MSSSIGDSSFRPQTGEIRHLDAAQARQLVGLFERPLVSDQLGLAYDASDSLTEATKGELTIQPAADHGQSAAVIGHYSTHLYLHELLRLPLSVARELTQHRGHLYLDKLVAVTDAVAEELAKHVGGGLSLNNLRQLSVPSAWALGRHAGELSLNRLASLDANAALGLAQHECQLYLGGLGRLSPVAAAALSQHRGDLFLEGLKELPGRVAAHLARHRGKLHVHGIAGLSDAVTEAFGGRQGFLCLQGVERLTPVQAQMLASHKGPLLFHRLAVDDAVAAGLARHEGSLSVNVGNGITLQQLELLVQHVGQIVLAGLTTIKERQARVLAAQTNWHGVVGLSGLFLDDVSCITPPVAAILATHQAGGLSLKGLSELTEDTARELVRHPILCLDGVSSISDGVAKILSRYEGATLSLKGLKTVSTSAISTLRENPAIELPRWFYGAGTLGTDRQSTALAEPTKPSQLETIRIIQQIARHGEQMLKK